MNRESVQQADLTRAFTCQFVLTFLLLLGDAAAAEPEENGACKAFPGTVTWPSKETWAKFNQSTGGKLIKPGPPPGAVCHPGEPTFNPDKCSIITAAWRTYDFHQSDPVSNMWQQYNNDTCLVDPNTPCSRAGYPAYVVNATTAMDVKLSLDFAREHNIRVIVKSSGHDYQGRSQAPGALSIWVHHMQDQEIHDHSFEPKGCNFIIETPAVTVGGGSQMGALYEELDKINRTVVGGASKSVSVGGYLTGGGHSALSPRYGLGADNVLEMEVVTPMGDIVTANECQNEDLFWAMRGGGGSTFGVMTSVTLATHPTPQIVGGIIAFLTQDISAPWIWDMVGYLASSLPYLVSKDVSGYALFPSNFTSPYINNGTGNFAGMGGDFVILDTQDINDMQQIWEPLVTHVKATWPDAIISLDLHPYPSFQSWFNVSYDQSPTGYDEYAGSRLLDEKALATQSTTLGEAFKLSQATALLVAGKGVRDAKPRGGSISVTPTWRKATVYTTNGQVFPPLNATARAEALNIVNNITEPFRKLAPDMGAYVNENNPGEPDWQHTFWGENYERLLQIKRKVDPEDILWCHPCVGNERWEQIGYRLCRTDGSFAEGVAQQDFMAR
ncbi:FAD-binding domain-containing protein [Xylaria cf. heliscus]|nr:FAD-binding domain-containing protein [Xylaria cf. heliscus]